MMILKICIRSNYTQKLIDERTKYFINPTGRFVVGGHVEISGLTEGNYSRHLWWIRSSWWWSFLWKGCTK
jgi:hypothetical protein